MTHDQVLYVIEQRAMLAQRAWLAGHWRVAEYHVARIRALVERLRSL